MLSKSYLYMVAMVALICSANAFSLNPNTATAEQLADELVGVGPKLAERIVEYRQQNGDFKSIEDLMQVKGIAENVVERNKHLIDISE